MITLAKLGEGVVGDREMSLGFDPLPILSLRPRD
jgi:hypothetical protein